MKGCGFALEVPKWEGFAGHTAGGWESQRNIGVGRTKSIGRRSGGVGWGQAGSEGGNREAQRAHSPVECGLGMDLDGPVMSCDWEFLSQGGGSPWRSCQGHE